MNSGGLHFTAIQSSLANFNLRERMSVGEDEMNSDRPILILLDEMNSESLLLYGDRIFIEPISILLDEMNSGRPPHYGKHFLIVR